MYANTSSKGEPSSTHDSDYPLREDALHHDSNSESDEDDSEDSYHSPGSLDLRAVYRNPGVGNAELGSSGQTNDVGRTCTQVIGDSNRGNDHIGQTGAGHMNNFGNGGRGGRSRQSQITYSSRPRSGLTRRLIVSSSTGGEYTFTSATHSGNRISADGGSERTNDLIQDVFGQLFQIMAPTPFQGRDLYGGAAHDGEHVLRHIFGPSILQGSVEGDAVYSQEALDRVMSQSMDQDPPSNAPPPASDKTVGRLRRQKLTEEMVGSEGKAVCTICINGMKVSDEVVVLPCKHWFHDECVVRWLKQHNTCPICRASIEKDFAHQSTCAQSSTAQIPSPRPSRPQRDPQSDEDQISRIER